MFLFSVALPVLQFFAAAPPCENPRLLGLVPWYEYLQRDPNDCSSILNFSNPDMVLGSHSAFLLIGLAILDDLIRVAALVAVGYIIYGGMQYVTSQGAPDATKKAQQTIINALVGVVIAIIAA